MGPNVYTNHSPTLPAISTGYEANTQKNPFEQADKDIDAERHSAAGLGVTAEPETMWAAATTAFVLRSPDRGPGLDVSAPRQLFVSPALRLGDRQG